MTILDKNERVELRALYDFDKNGILDKFLSKYQDLILRRPTVSTTEWDHIRTSLSKEAEALGIDRLKEQFNIEISNMEVEDGE